ncbi:hypothetical protein LY76DRAFT_413480 [Colletotrichum caudatum]|nr:hypothetical protein LY76DRAFT_413480 [Colletotrichum caudatum]
MVSFLFIGFYFFFLLVGHGYGNQSVPCPIRCRQKRGGGGLSCMPPLEWASQPPQPGPTQILVNIIRRPGHHVVVAFLIIIFMCLAVRPLPRPQVPGLWIARTSA